MKSPAHDAIETLARKGLLPTAYSSEEARDMLARSLRRASVFSARTTNARYVQAIREAVARVQEGGRGNDWPQIRLELKDLLAKLGYTPEKGFPGDDKLGIPPAKPGSLRDLSSTLRLELVVRTQEALVRGSAQKARGADPAVLQAFPAWELIRAEERDVPRGSPESPSIGWMRRWQIAGGPPPVDGDRMIAPKWHPVWRKLGDSRIFDDALDVDHPPFCFGSGMGWEAITAEECRDVGVALPAEFQAPDISSFPPDMKMVLDALDRDMRDALRRAGVDFDPDAPGYAILRQAAKAAADRVAARQAAARNGGAA